MGKKGAKRKTRWRSLSIGAPPGEEDEEDEVHNGYQLENGNGSVKGERNTQGGYSSHKRTRLYNHSTNTYGYGYGSLYNGHSKSSQSKTNEDQTKPKIVFNEEEYMRITTPRQDVLFKKGYLSRKKPLASTASTSATSATTTPSTNESQSAAHSTADGSETAEDQQLLDGSNGGEFTIVPEAAAQFAYGGFYDQVTGYYYEYPVMLVGPPVPGHPSPNVLAAMSCGPVPLRPVEWFNPQYMPELLQEQHPPPHSTDSQAGSCGSSISMDEVGGTGAPVNVEVVSGSEHRDEEITTEDAEVTVNDEQTTELLQPAQIIPQIIPHMHMPPQHYVYPGHFMFGPPMVNMNGITIQNGAIVPSEALWEKRRKKKKRRKQRRPLTVGNTEDEEEEYSSEWESSSNWSQPAWSTSTTTRVTNDTATSRPLNPEVQEFQFRSTLPVLPDISDVATLDSRDADTSPLSHQTAIIDERCDKVAADNDTRIVPTDNTNLSSIVNLNSKDKPSEIILENTRVKETSEEDVSLDVTDNSLENNDCNVPVLTNENEETQSTVPEEAEDKTKSQSNGILIPEKETSLAKGDSVIENSKKFDQSDSVIEENGVVDQSNNIKSDTKITEALITSSESSYLNEGKNLSNNNGHLESSEENHIEQNVLKEACPKESAETNGQNVKSIVSDVNQVNSSPVSSSRKPDNETSNKKGGNKNVKKGKGKAMDARKTGRNKRETRNSQQSDATSSAVLAESLQGAEGSTSVEARQSLDSECSKSQLPLTKPSSRPTSPEINQTTTPINAETHRLPESYESLVTRSSPPSITSSPLPPGAPIAPPRRKYSAKGLKFVREPTPGPDLDTDVKSDNEEAGKIDASTAIAHEESTSCIPNDNNDLQIDNNENATEEATAISDASYEVSDTNVSPPRIETRFNTQRTTDEKLPCNTADLVSAEILSNKSDVLPNISVEELGQVAMDSLVINPQENVDSMNRDIDAASTISDHPITDAVAAWLERTKSPDMFRVPIPISDSDDSDLSETEIYDGDPNNKPSKNLQGNPMPALSVSNGSIDICERLRSNIVTSGNFTKTDAFDTSKPIERRREKDNDNIEKISPTNKNGRSIKEILSSFRVCEFTIKGSAAGMRVAKNSRVDLNRVNTERKPSKHHSKTNYVENIEMKVKSSTNSNDNITENGIEALENVKTYERGEIVVSLDGKLLMGTTLEPTCSEKSNQQDPGTEGMSGSSIDIKEVRRSESRSIELDRSNIARGNSEHEMSPVETINSLGSIEEPDVLECWETEIMEPVVVLKNNKQMMKLQVDGEVHDGEATEEENYDNHDEVKTREHVKKYYRLAKEYTMSIEDELSERALKQMNSNNVRSNSNSPKRTTPNTPERMIECLCSEEIPIIVPLPKSTSTKVNKVVKDGKEIEAVDEAFEVYESCYTEKTRLAGVPQQNVEGSKIPFENQEGPVPCKAVCCNIQ